MTEKKKNGQDGQELKMGFEHVQHQLTELSSCKILSIWKLDDKRDSEIEKYKTLCWVQHFFYNIQAQ